MPRQHPRTGALWKTSRLREYPNPGTHPHRPPSSKALREEILRLQGALETSAGRATKLERKVLSIRAEHKEEAQQRQAQALMPLNRELLAVNVVQGAIPEPVLQDAVALYEALADPYPEPEA
jgi:hypothetical protein